MDMGIGYDKTISILFVSEKACNSDIITVHDPIENIFCLFEILPFQSGLSEDNKFLLQKLESTIRLFPC